MGGDDRGSHPGGHPGGAVPFGNPCGPGRRLQGELSPTLLMATTLTETNDSAFTGQEVGCFMSMSRSVGC